MIETRELTVRVGGGDRPFELRNVSLTIPARGYGVVVGPAGSGKTTLLEAIAGVRPVAAGTVRLHGRDMREVPPEHRELAIVYQHAHLFPHLDAAANCAYGARDRALVDALRERFGIAALERQDVQALSGGERQLVALVRALARRPRVLLLDEPFGALDPSRRVLARRTVRALQHEWGLTVLQVTHDFAEAGALGEVIVLLDRGEVVQQGEPAVVFRRPATPFAASFLGAENLFAGEVIEGEVRAESRPDAAHSRHQLFQAGPLTLHVVGDAPAGPAHAVLRADEVFVARTPLAASARNQFEGEVLELAPAVGSGIVVVTVAVQGIHFVATLTRSAVEELVLAAGERVWIAFKASAVHLC